MSAESDARQFGWAKPPAMTGGSNLRGGGGLRYIDKAYGEAWQAEMERLGQYPPPPPKGPSFLAMP